jgi:competence protein ComEC
VPSLATAPYAAFHFNRFVDYGLVANLFALPIMALWIMPWAVAAFVLMIVGLEQLALTPMGWGIDVVLSVAQQVSDWPGAVTPIPTFPIAALATFIAGGLWLCLWSTTWRLLGLEPMFAGMVFAWAYQGPDILVDRDAKFFGVLMSDGKFSFSGRQRNFVAEHWLRRNGHVQYQAWPRHGRSEDGWLTCDGLGCPYRQSGVLEEPPNTELVALVTKEPALTED